MKRLVLGYILLFYASIPLAPLLIPTKYLGFFDWIHYLAYALFFILLFPIFDMSFIKTLGISISLAISDEMIQWFLPNRTGEIVDVLRDFIGALIGLVIVTLWLDFKELKAFRKEEI